MFCKQCGSKLREDAVFCSNCGYKISSNDDKNSNSVNTNKSKDKQSNIKTNILIYIIMAVAAGFIVFKVMFCSVCGQPAYKNGLCKEHYETKVATDIATDIYNKIFK